MSDADEPRDPSPSECDHERAPHREHFAEGEEAAPPGARVMAVLRWLLVLAAAAAAVASLSYVFGNAGQTEDGDEGVRYYCPMHPSVIQDHPGDCPICNMTLVVREPEKGREHHAHEKARVSSVEGLVPVEITAERVQLIGMRTAKVERATLPSELRTVGYVAPAESGLSVVQTRFSGFLQELHVAEAGRPVSRGQLLARVYSPELLAAQQELLHAKQWSSASGEGPGQAAPQGDLADDARERLVLMGMHPDEVAEVERTGVAHRLVEIRSPVRGYVAQKAAVEGLQVQPGMQLFEIADLSKVWVLVDVFERDAARVRVGQSAKLKLTAYPSQLFAGKVQLVYPSVSADTRTLRARVEFENPNLSLRPGMFGDVTLEVAPSEGLSVPREAIVDTGEHQYVFVVDGPGRFSPRAVRVGEVAADRAQVLTGLREGETVVTTGNFLVDSESRLRATIDGAEAAPGR